MGVVVDSYYFEFTLASRYKLRMSKVISSCTKIQFCVSPAPQRHDTNVSCGY